MFLFLRNSILSRSEFHSFAFIPFISWQPWINPSCFFKQPLYPNFVLKKREKGTLIIDTFFVQKDLYERIFQTL